MTLCNMVVEAGGKNGVVPADSTTFKYIEVSLRVLFGVISTLLPCISISDSIFLLLLLESVFLFTGQDIFAL